MTIRWGARTTTKKLRAGIIGANYTLIAHAGAQSMASSVRWKLTAGFGWTTYIDEPKGPRTSVASKDTQDRNRGPYLERCSIRSGGGIEFLAHQFCCRHHIAERLFDLRPMACFEAAVGIHPNLIRRENCFGLAQ